MSIKLVGVDIGFTHTGIVYALAKWESDKIILTPTHVECVHTDRLPIMDDPKALQGYKNFIRCTHVIKELAKHVKGADVIAVELPGGNTQSSRAATALGACVGITASLEVIQDPNTKLIVVKPSTVKKVVKVNGAVEKDECMQWVKDAYPAFSWPKTKRDFEHIADAMLVLEACKQSTTLRNKLTNE